MVQFLKDLWNMITFPVKYYIEYFKDKKREKQLEKKIKELQKRDPFIYKQEVIKLMTEFTKGIVNAVKDRMDESIALAIIFFIGHIVIAMIVVSVVTGASIWEAGAVALVEPAVNSIWFYVLHKLWTKYSK